MRAQEFVSEMRQGPRQLIRDLFPAHWPDFVVNDLLVSSHSKFQRINTAKDLLTAKVWVADVLKWLPVKQWRLETRNLSYASFNGDTQSKILARTGQTYQSRVPRDRERFDAQVQLIKKTGAPNPEPIICVQRPGVDGLELVEGWHRTIQNITNFPNGWRQQVWVGYI